MAEDQPIIAPAVGDTVRPSLRAKYGDDALRYTKAVLQTAWAFVPQLQIRNAGNLFDAYLTELEIYRTARKKECVCWTHDKLPRFGLAVNEPVEINSLERGADGIHPPC